MSKLLEALAEFQANPPALVKDSENPHYGNTYVSLGGILAVVMPRLSELGLTLTQELSSVGDQPALKTTLRDTENNSISDTVPLILDRQGPQAVGSAITYMRRYSILSLLGLNADEDDDAEAATEDASFDPQTGKGSLGTAKF